MVATIMHLGDMLALAGGLARSEVEKKEKCGQVGPLRSL